MRKTLLAGAFFASSAGAAGADDLAALARCAAMKPDAVRLACFDAIARDRREAPPQPRWTLVSRKDPISDARRDVIYRESDAVLGHAGGVLGISCQARIPAVMVIPPQPHGFAVGAFIEATIRLDGGDARSWTFDATSAQAFGELQKDRIEWMVAMMNGAKRLALRFRTYGGGANRKEITLVFDVSGLAGSLPQLPDGCGLKRS
jgi:hypothetical protein